MSDVIPASSYMSNERWAILGPSPDWVKAGQIVLRIDPLAKLEDMSLRDIADFFSARSIAVPQGGDPTKEVTEEQLAMLKGDAN